MVKASYGKRFNPLETEDSDVKFYIVIDIARKHSSRFTATKLLEHLEEMFPLHHRDNNVISRLKSVTTHWCVIRLERVSELYGM